MVPLNPEEEEGLSFPITNFTQFFTSLDDETLTVIAHKYPESLKVMCIALTLDQQIIAEKSQKKSKQKLD